MSIKEAFKAGFVKEIVRQGYSPDRFEAELVKCAGTVADIMAGLGTGVGAMGTAGKGLMIAIPTTAALGGWALGSQDSVNKGDIKDLEQLATVHEYENAIKQMRQSDEAHGKRVKRKRAPIAGQSTQSVVQPEMAKAALLAPGQPATNAVVSATDNRTPLQKIQAAEAAVKQLKVAKPAVVPPVQKG